MESKRKKPRIKCLNKDYKVSLYLRDEVIESVICKLSIKDIKKIMNRYLEIDKEYYELTDKKNPLIFKTTDIKDMAWDLFFKLDEMEEDYYIFGDDHYYHYIFEKVDLSISEDIFLQRQRYGIWNLF